MVDSILDIIKVTIVADSGTKEIEVPSSYATDFFNTFKLAQQIVEDFEATVESLVEGFVNTYLGTAQAAIDQNTSDIADIQTQQDINTSDIAELQEVDLYQRFYEPGVWETPRMCHYSKIVNMNNGPATDQYLYIEIESDIGVLQGDKIEIKNTTNYNGYNLSVLEVTGGGTIIKVQKNYTVDEVPADGYLQLFFLYVPKNKDSVGNNIKNIYSRFYAQDFVGPSGTGYLEKYRQVGNRAFRCEGVVSGDGTGSAGGVLPLVTYFNTNFTIKVSMPFNASGGTSFYFTGLGTGVSYKYICRVDYNIYTPLP